MADSINKVIIRRQIFIQAFFGHKFQILRNLLSKTVR